MITALPICFYPMRKIVLDDDYAFSQSILLKMHQENFASYNSPELTLKYLLQEYRPTLTKTDLLIKDLSSHHIVNINVEKLKESIQEPSNDISILFIDYHMPEMNGIEFLKKIQKLPIKKVLLTGETDYKIGIDAFNSGLVDAYIRKDDLNFSTLIQNITTELEWKYFTELSNLVPNILDFDYLKNPNFFELFKQFIEENGITKFYLTHLQGDFVLLNKNEEKQHLLVRNKDQLKYLTEIAKEDGADFETIEKLETAKVIPFFNSKEYWEVPANEWSKYLHSTLAISSDDNLVWAIIK